MQAEFYPGDTLKIQGDKADYHTVESICEEGWIYFHSGLAIPPAKQHLLSFVSPKMSDSGSFAWFNNG